MRGSDALMLAPVLIGNTDKYKKLTDIRGTKIKNVVKKIYM